MINTNNHSQVEIIYDQDFIVVYQGLDQEVCNSIVRLFDSDSSKWRGKIDRSEGVLYEGKTKNSWDLEIVNEGIWQDTFHRIHPKIQSCINHYLARSPILQAFDLIATGYKIQMYPKNQGYFRWHADSVGGNTGDRVVAMVLYLNDVETGGETEFFHQGIKIAPKIGNLVLFPSGWNYMHCGHMPVSDNKYIISMFIKVKQ